MIAAQNSVCVLYHSGIYYYYKVLAIWDWTVEGEVPVCSVMLDQKFGIQVGRFFIHVYLIRSQLRY